MHRSYHFLPTSQLSRYLGLGDVEFVKFVVFLEELAIQLVLVRTADLLRNRPAGLPEQPRIVIVVGDALLQILDAFDDPMIAIAVVVELDGDVVGKVPGEMDPDRNEMRLDDGDLVERGFVFRPIFLHLVFVRFFPKHERRHAAEAQGGEFDGLAGGIDFAELRLAET